MKKKLFFLLVILTIWGAITFGFIGSIRAAALKTPVTGQKSAEIINKVIISESGDYVFKPEWFNAASRTWISQEPSLVAKLSGQYGYYLKLDRNAEGLGPLSKLLIVDERNPKNQIETFEIREVVGGNWLRLNKPLKNQYKSGSVIKSYIKEYNGYYPSLGEDVDLGYFEVGKEVVFSHLTYWNSRFNKTGHLVFGPSYSFDSYYYRITQLSSRAWRFEFDDGVKFDGGYNDGSFRMEKKGVPVETLTISVNNVVPVGTVARGADNVSLGSWNFSLRAQDREVVISRIRIDIDIESASASATDLTNIALYTEDGALVTSVTDGSTDTSTSSDGYVVFTDTFTVPAGGETYILKADLSTRFTNNDTVQVAVDATAGSNLVGKDELTSQPIVVSPVAEIEANLQTVKTGALQVATSTTNSVLGTRIIRGVASPTVLAEVRYDAVDSGEDVKITRIRIVDNPAGGAISSYVDGLRLYNKETGEELVPDTYPDFDETRPNRDDFVDFDLTGYPLIVPKGSAVTLLVKGVINNNETPFTTHSFGNATSTAGVIARGVETGEAITETYSDTFGNWLTVIDHGVMTIKKSYNSPASRLLIAGTTEQTIAVFDVFALYEDITLDYLKLNFTSGNSSPNDIERIHLYDENGNRIESAYVTASSTAFYNLIRISKPFTVHSGEARQLYIKVDLAEVGVQRPGTSGHQIGYKIAGPGDFAGKGLISGAATEVVGVGAEAPIGSTFTLVKGAPIITHLPLGAGESRLFGYEPNKTIYRFSIGADALGGDIGVYKMMFKVSINKASATNFYLYDVTSQERINYTSSSVNLDSEGLLTFYLDSDGYPLDQEKEERVIASGATRKYELRADTYGNASSSADTIVVNMLHDMSQGPYPAFAQQIDDNGFKFIWTDRSAVLQATSTLDWYNGYLVTGRATSTASVLTD